MRLGARILVVDDNEDFRMLMREVLQEKGYAVHEAGDGTEALRVMEETEIDMAIVDLDMPRMNGLELTAKVKEEDPNFPILIVTAYASFYSPADILASGVDAFLQKPVQVERLLKVIEQL